jgi:NTP pyrophosphatase (non-canonical NTP hydrolase)
MNEEDSAFLRSFEERMKEFVIVLGEHMYLNQYQTEALKTAIYPGKGTLQGLVYTALGLGGETGEILEKVKKILRDASSDDIEGRKEAIILEMGDVLWYLAAMAFELGVDLETVATRNTDKLAKRAQKGTLQGNGDTR